MQISQAHLVNIILLKKIIILTSSQCQVLLFFQRAHWFAIDVQENIEIEPNLGSLNRYKMWHFFFNHMPKKLLFLFFYMTKMDVLIGV